MGQTFFHADISFPVPRQASVFEISIKLRGHRPFKLLPWEYCKSMTYVVVVVSVGIVVVSDGGSSGSGGGGGSGSCSGDSDISGDGSDGGGRTATGR